MKTVARLNRWVVRTPWTELGCAFALIALSKVLAPTNPLTALWCVMLGVMVFVKAPRG